MKVFLFASFLLLALSTRCAYAEQSVCTDDDACIAPGSWQFGIALGLGGRTNPLVDGDTIPLIVLPDIAWYGETFYFDNGELGAQLARSEHSSVEWFITPNTQKANFTFWHTANILVPAASFTSTPGSESNPDPEAKIDLSVDEVSRKWAFDTGVRWQWYSGNHHFRASVFTDISGVYKGTHASLEYRYRLYQNDSWLVSISPQITWMSTPLTEYYYGVRKTDTPDQDLLYSATGGVQWGVNTDARYKINAHWRVLVRAGITTLHNGMKDSPLVEDSHVATFFAGFAYRF